MINMMKRSRIIHNWLYELKWYNNTVINTKTSSHDLTCSVIPGPVVKLRLRKKLGTIHQQKSFLFGVIW